LKDFEREKDEEATWGNDIAKTCKNVERRREEGSWGHLFLP